MRAWKVLLITGLAMTMIAVPVFAEDLEQRRGMQETHPEALRQLCRKADILLPNVTEAALLTGIPYRDTADEAYLNELLQGLLAFGVKAVCITGIEKGDQVGYYGIADGEIFSSFSQKQTTQPRQSCEFYAKKPCSLQ